MTDHARTGIRQLAERLSREYADVLPPGQVLALVFRTEWSLLRTAHLPADSRLQACESVVRRSLEHGTPRRYPTAA